MENDAIVDTIMDNLWQEYEAKDFESFIKSIGFISLKVENGKAFIYAVNPMLLLDTGILWESVSQSIEKKFGLTLLISNYFYGEESEEYYGKPIQRKILKKLYA